MGLWAEARRDGRSAVTKRRELVSACLAGTLAAGILLVAGFPGSARDTLIGIGAAVVVGVVLVPGAAFLWSAVTYETRHLRADLRTAIDHLQVGSIASHPVPSPRPALAVELDGLLRRGKRLQSRGPQRAGESLPPSYPQEFMDWVGDVQALLEKRRPDLAKEFAQPLTHSILEQVYHPFYIQIGQRLDQLKDIIADVEAAG